MDLHYIKMITESYYNDHPNIQHLYKTRKDYVNDIFEEIKTIIAGARLENYQIYQELQSYDKRDQQKILYHLIEMSLYDRFPKDIKLYCEQEDYDKIYEAYLNESILTISAATGLGVLLLNLLWRTTPISKVRWNALNTFDAVNEKIHKLISKFTKESRVNTAIMYNNAQKCYNECGIKDTKTDFSWRLPASLMSHSSDRHKDNINAFETVKSREQAYCLTNCYLDWSINQLGEFASNIVTCLRNTGERGNELSDINIDLFEVPSNSICKPYFDIFKDYKKYFIDALDVVCKDSTEKEVYLRKYSEILNEKLGRSKINTDPHFDKDKIQKKFFTPQNNRIR